MWFQFYKYIAHTHDPIFIIALKYDKIIYTVIKVNNNNLTVV